MRIRSFAVIALAAGLLPLAGGAELKLESGVKLVPPAANTGAVAASEQASTVRDTRKSGGDTLRCWQHGRLLYEGSGFRSPPERSPNAISIPRMGEGEAVTLLDLKDGFCILSRS